MSSLGFEDILSAINDSNDKEAIHNLAQKYPTLKEGWLRQSEYSRRHDELRATIAERDAWKQWEQENWSTDRNMPKAEAYWRDRAAELERELQDEAMKTPSWDDIKTEATKHLVSKDELAARETAFMQHMQGSTYFDAALNEFQGQHLHEFGKPMKTREFVSKLSEWNETDLDRGFEKYVSEERKAREEARLKEREDRIRNEALAKGREEAQKELASQRYPVDSDGGMRGNVGPFEAKIRGLNGKTDGQEHATLGDDTTAMLAAREYYEKQAGITQ